MTKNKKPIYEIGKADPIYYIYDSPGALDYKCSLDGNIIGNIQAIFFIRELDVCNKVTQDNKLVFLDFPYSENQYEKELRVGNGVGKRVVFVIETTCKQGEKTYTNKRCMEILFTKFSGGIAVDDIVTEYTYTFKILKEIDNV